MQLIDTLETRSRKHMLLSSASTASLWSTASWVPSVRAFFAASLKRWLGNATQQRFGAAQFEKPGIFEVDLHEDALRAQVPNFAELFLDDALVDHLDVLLPELELERGTKARTIKLQHNRGGGGCFPAHYDNAGPPNRRAVSCLVYLNPIWSPGDGGELVLWPFLRQPVSVPPLMDRAVLFLSDRVLHRVAPAVAERFCFTIWLDGAGVNTPAQCNITAGLLGRLREKSEEAEESLQAFCRSPLQRSVSRAVYAAEYEASLRECMRGTEGAEVMFAEHGAHVESLQRHPQISLLLERLCSRRPASIEPMMWAATAG